MSNISRSEIRTGGGFFGAIAATVGLYSVVQFILRLRRRAQHPSMNDPASRIMSLLRIAPSALILVLVAANVLAVATWGVVAVIALVVIDALALVAAGVAALLIWERAERRRRSAGYLISELDYPAAPRQVKAVMRRIFRSARYIRGGKAYVDGMFGDIQLDQLVYAAAERAVLSSELSTAVTDLKPDATAADREVLKTAEEQIDEIIAYLRGVESSLEAGARAAGGLSERIEEPEKQREAVRKAEAAADSSAARRTSARSLIEDVTARASAKTQLDPTDVGDRIHSVAAGYQEVTEVSRAANRSPDVADSFPAEGDDSKQSVNPREAAWRAAKTTANKTARASTAAAKAGAERYKNGSRDN